MDRRSTREADWLALPDALERILSAVAPLPRERVFLSDALGRTLAEAVGSPIDQPPWDNSAMDGFAVRAADVRGATREAPVTLELIEAVPAGEFPTRPVGPGQATQIMTGAPVPDGADSVVRIEHTDAWPTDGDPRSAIRDRIAVFNDSDAGRNIRRRGEDLESGTTVLDAGAVLRAAEIGVLATVGRAQVAVHRRPRVAILSNGDELAELDRFDQVLAGRKIANSNAYALEAAVRAAGGVPIRLGIARDDVDSLREHLEAGLDADALVTTAGASVGEHDLIKDVLEAIGFELDFWRVKIRPGSPFSFGRIGGMPVFGLAGNPVSALVTFEMLVRPAIRRMLGRDRIYPRVIRVRAAERVGSKPGLLHLFRVMLEPGDALPRARLTGPQGSGILTSMAAADALLVVPERSDGVPAGAEAAAIPLAAPDEGAAALDFAT